VANAHKNATALAGPSTAAPSFLSGGDRLKMGQGALERRTV
jgi:hypothetical protein